MKNLETIVLGSVALVAALTLNFRHALNDYGILENKLHVEVLAQSNGSGGGTGGDGTAPGPGGGTGGGGTNSGGGTVIDGGELPGGDITCSSSGSGKCYYVHVTEGLYGACYFSCKANGNPNSNCSSFWVNLVNLCSAMSTY